MINSIINGGLAKHYLSKSIWNIWIIPPPQCENNHFLKPLLDFFFFFFIFFHKAYFAYVPSFHLLNVDVYLPFNIYICNKIKPLFLFCLLWFQFFFFDIRMMLYFFTHVAFWPMTFKCHLCFTKSSPRPLSDMVVHLLALSVPICCEHQYPSRWGEG